MDATVSVVIPTYRRNELLREAIDSVLQQRYEPVEIIVVDDSGTGYAAPVCAEYEAVTSIIRDENGGWGPAYTDGITAATGDYIQFLDDDDYLLPGRLRKSVDLIGACESVGVVYSGLIQDTRGPQYPNPSVSGNVLEHTLRAETYPCLTSTLLIDSTILTDLLPLPRLPAGNDLNLMIDLARRTHFDYVDECLVYRRAETSRMWVGLRRFEGMRQVIERQREVYDRFPAIRREVLADLHEREGQYRLERTMWSWVAILCFAKAAYFATDTRYRCAAQIVAAIFGAPGLSVARSVRETYVSVPVR